MGNSRVSSLSSIKIQAGRLEGCSRCRCPWPYRDIPLALLASLANSCLASLEKPFERPSAVSFEASVEGCLCLAPRMSAPAPASVLVPVRVVAGRPCLGIGPGHE